MVRQHSETEREKCVRTDVRQMYARRGDTLKWETDL